MSSHKSEVSNEPFVPGEGDPEPLGTAVTVIVGAILVYIVIVLLQGVFYRTQEAEVARKTYGIPPQDLTLARSTQLEVLSSYRWLDQPRGVVRVPIDRAMELVIQESRSQTTPSPAAIGSTDSHAAPLGANPPASEGHALPAAGSTPAPSTTAPHGGAGH